jgi:uncharacterized small protein (DUF1192 family)
LFAITEKLGGHTVDQYAEMMSVSELHEWRAYFEWKEKKRKKAQQKAKNKSRVNRRPARRR